MLMPSPSTVVAGLLETEPKEPAIIELWDAWTFAEIDAEFALRRWWEAFGDETETAFCAYRAALEREAQAATVLAARLSKSGALAGSC
jgi:glutathione S-transferase